MFLLSQEIAFSIPELIILYANVKADAAVAEELY
jgi:hypothetical protein